MDYFTAANYSSSDYGSNSNSCSVTKNNVTIEKEIKGGGGGKSKSKGVMRLSTDPQSVAARERRHRISDRFKILQSLVPGGTKMDTVSMLEEAIHYVKFLKTQIWLHQTMMINFADDDGDDHHRHHDPSSPMFQYQLPAHHHDHPITDSLDHHLPHHHHHNQQTHEFYPHNNFVSAASVQPQISPAFDLPPADSDWFQGQDTMAMVNNIEAYMKYYS